MFHVDDILLSSDNDAAADAFMTALLTPFQRREESLDRYLGMRIDHETEEGTITLDQARGVLDLLREQQTSTALPAPRL